jgi:hypothetical protein
MTDRVKKVEISNGAPVSRFWPLSPRVVVWFWLEDLSINYEG